MTNYVYADKHFKLLLQNAAKNQIEAKIALRLAVQHTLNLDARRDGQWILSFDQLKMLAAKLPSFADWLKCLGVWSDSGLLCLGAEYHNHYQIYIPNQHPILVDADSLLVSSSWLRDLKTGYYAATGTLRQWLDAFILEGVPLSSVHGFISLIEAGRSGVVYESQVIAGIPWVVARGPSGTVLQIVPEEAELSFAQWGCLDYTLGADEVSHHLTHAIERNDFSVFDGQMLMYALKARIFDGQVKCASGATFYQADLNSAPYQPLNEQDAVLLPISQGKELLIIGKYDSHAAQLGLDKEHRMQVISPELDFYARQWLVNIGAAGLDPYSVLQREHFNSGLQQVMSSVKDPIMGELLLNANSRLEVTGVYALNQYSQAVEVHTDGRLAQKLYDKNGVAVTHALSRSVS